MRTYDVLIEPDCAATKHIENLQGWTVIEVLCDLNATANVEVIEI